MYSGADSVTLCTVRGAVLCVSHPPPLISEPMVTGVNRNTGKSTVRTNKRKGGRTEPRGRTRCCRRDRDAHAGRGGVQLFTVAFWFPVACGLHAPGGRKKGVSKNSRANTQSRESPLAPRGALEGAGGGTGPAWREPAQNEPFAGCGVRAQSPLPAAGRVSARQEPAAGLRGAETARTGRELAARGRLWPSGAKAPHPKETGAPGSRRNPRAPAARCLGSPWPGCGAPALSAACALSTRPWPAPSPPARIQLPVGPGPISSAGLRGLGVGRLRLYVTSACLRDAAYSLRPLSGGKMRYGGGKQWVGP